jgi:cbb3-type cytochrome oxidase subunit 3
VLGRNAAEEGRSEMLAAMGFGIIGTIILIIVVIAVIAWFLRRA